MDTPQFSERHSAAPLDATVRVEMLEAMLRIRSHDEALAALASPSSPGTCTAVGQEACAVGVMRALQPRDRILTNHRSAGHLLARGADPRRTMAEVMGRVDGYCKGKSGTLHISAVELGVVLTSTIVGGELSMAPGVALAQTLRAEGTEPGGITAVFFGDGAACEGIFHESVNLAVTWRLPVLYVCENNQWQAFVPRGETMPFEHVANWVAGHGIESRIVDGNDVEAVYQAAQELAAAIRADGRPRLLELTTYRRRGHFEPDDQAYVPAAELEAWKARDPIDLQAARLLAAGMLTPAELATLRTRARASMEAAVTFAQASPWPGPGEIATDVYA
jgi:pyruvate dehydrogenase E1 component alpha subunit